MMLPARSAMQQRRVFGEGLRHGHQRVERLPCDGEICGIEGQHRRRLAHDAGHRLAPEQDRVDGKDRLVDEARDHAEGVEPGHIRRRQDGRDVAARREGREVTKGEARMRIGRADHPGDERALGGHIVAEKVPPLDLGEPVETPRRRAEFLRRHLQRIGSMGTHHRIDDLAIAGAAAEHPAQRVLHLRRIGLRHAAQQRHGGNHHAGRADPALRGLMMLKTFLEPQGIGIVHREPRQRLDMPPRRLLHAA